MGIILKKSHGLEKRSDLSTVKWQNSPHSAEKKGVQKERGSCDFVCPCNLTMKIQILTKHMYECLSLSESGDIPCARICPTSCNRCSSACTHSAVMCAKWSDLQLWVLLWWVIFKVRVGHVALTFAMVNHIEGQSGGMQLFDFCYRESYWRSEWGALLWHAMVSHT